MFYDTHSHPYLAKKLSETIVLENFFSWGWKYLNSIWCNINSSISSIELAKKYTWVFACIWIHPTHVLDYINQDIDDVIGQLEKLYITHWDTIVGIWETGLDYHWLESLSERYNISQKQVVSLQKKYFKAQIKLAKKLGLPIIIHSLINFAPNCKLWFWGVVTFKNAKITQEVVKNIDLKHIIIETDSPYLTPEPHRGKRENEPILCKEVLSKIIDLREEWSEYITEKILENSREFFKV